MMEAAFACRTRVAAELDAFLVPAATLPPEQSNLGEDNNYNSTYEIVLT